MKTVVKNKGAFRIGTVFVGNVNGVIMQVIDIFHKQIGTGIDGKVRYAPTKSVKVKNLYDNSIHTCGLAMLEHCDTTILC